MALDSLTYLRGSVGVNIILSVVFTSISCYVCLRLKQKKLDVSATLTWVFFQFNFLLYIIHSMVYLANMSSYADKLFDINFINDPAFMKLNSLLSMLDDLLLDLCYYHFIFEMKTVLIVLTSHTKLENE